jgi:hypothetical protein
MLGAMPPITRNAIASTFIENRLDSFEQSQISRGAKVELARADASDKDRI